MLSLTDNTISLPYFVSRTCIISWYGIDCQVTIILVCKICMLCVGTLNNLTLNNKYDAEHYDADVSKLFIRLDSTVDTICFISQCEFIFFINAYIYLATGFYLSTYNS